MRVMIMSLIVCGMAASMNADQKSSMTCIVQCSPCSTGCKKPTSIDDERALFSKKYKDTFGEEPSATVWNLGKGACETEFCKACGTEDVKKVS